MDNSSESTKGSPFISNQRKESLLFRSGGLYVLLCVTFCIIRLLHLKMHPDLGCQLLSVDLCVLQISRHAHLTCPRAQEHTTGEESTRPLEKNHWLRIRWWRYWILLTWFLFQAKLKTPTWALSMAAAALTVTLTASASPRQVTSSPARVLASPSTQQCLTPNVSMSP